jgi:uncharacterized protein (UPF0261 family)
VTTPQVLLIGTLDTKANEIEYVHRKLEELNTPVTVVDSGILGTPGIPAHIPREEVARAAGLSIAEVQAAGSRGAAVEHMQRGLAALARAAFDRGEVAGVLCLGGAEGALLGAAAMKVLPLGIPKLIVSPSASGRREFGPFMGSSDILVMHSVIDILSLNGVARSVFDNAASAMAGMCRWAGKPPAFERPAVGVTMLGQTTRGAMALVDELDRNGYETIIFHANGVGGPALDDFARDGLLVGVVDFTLSEVANTPFDGVHATGPDRLRAVASAGLPLLVVPGACDFFNQGPMDSLPEAYRRRLHYMHNPVATLVRVLADEEEALGRDIAERLRSATAPTAVLVPTLGLSGIGSGDGPIADHDADAALFAALRAALPPQVRYTEVDLDINDHEFGELAARELLKLLEQGRRGE